MPKTKHGMYKTPAYKRWIGMKSRCANDPKYTSKGITVCERWLHSFENFYADMGDPPPGLTLDRIDGTKGYSPDNCRWATYAEQSRNLSNNDWVGGELLGDIAARAGVTRNTVDYRKRKGLPLDVPPIDKRETCKKGHPWTDDNTYITQVKYKGGLRLQKYCRACRAQHQADLRERRRVTDHTLLQGLNSSHRGNR